MITVLKDDAYGHGAVPVARAAVTAGVSFIALITLQEAVTLREAGIEKPILLMGEREPAELPFCVEYNLTTVLNDLQTAKLLGGFRNHRRNGNAVVFRIQRDECQIG